MPILWFGSSFWGDEIDEIFTVDPINFNVIEHFDAYKIYPASIFVTTKERIAQAIQFIERDMAAQVDYFRAIGKPYEAKRIYERVNYDLEMIKELGYCSGIENYSRYFDGRPARKSSVLFARLFSTGLFDGD